MPKTLTTGDQVVAEGQYMNCSFILSDDGNYSCRTRTFNHVKLLGFVGNVVVTLFDNAGNLVTHVGPVAYGVTPQLLNPTGADRTDTEFGSIAAEQVQRVDRIEILFGLSVKDIFWNGIKDFGQFVTQVAGAISSIWGSKASPQNLQTPAKGQTQALVSDSGQKLLRTAIAGLAPATQVVPPTLKLDIDGGPVHSGAPTTLTVVAKAMPGGSPVDGTVSYDGIQVGKTNQPITHTFVGHRGYQTVRDENGKPRRFAIIAFDPLDIQATGFPHATIALPAEDLSA